MDVLLLVGLPKQLVKRFRAFAGERFLVREIAMDTGKENQPYLLPHPSQAAALAREWINDLDDTKVACLVVLPYAPIPAALEQELAAFQGLGVSVQRPVPGQDGWPGRPKRKGFEQPFLDGIFGKMKELFQLSPANVAPSKYFADLQAETPRFLIAPGAVDEIDDVASHRFDFMRRAGDALVRLVDADGVIGEPDEFFLGLDLATTGGIDAGLDVYVDGSVVHQATTNHHLKKGDYTTPQAAVRVYFHGFHAKGKYYVAVLYAGPHPSKNCRRRIDLPQDA